MGGFDFRGGVDGMGDDELKAPRQWQGNQILASIGKRIHGKFISHLEEGGMYTIKTVDLNKAKPHFRVVDNNFAVHFLQTTIVRPTPSEGFTIPLHKFTRIPYTQLSARLGLVTNITDAIGSCILQLRLRWFGLEIRLKEGSSTLKSLTMNVMKWHYWVTRLI